MVPLVGTPMPATPDLVMRSGDLKRALVDFVHQPRFAHALRQALQRRFGKGKRIVADEVEITNFVDSFILQHRLPDGRTAVEHFVVEHPELPEEERAMLLGWRDVVEGIFEIQRREGDALIVTNLVDEMTYSVRSNMGPSVLGPLRGGAFLLARLVPIGDEWLLSGMASMFPETDRAAAYSAAAEVATRQPRLVLRNPEKLAQAWELQRQERGYFIRFFGSDLVVLPGRELDERMREYAHFRTYVLRDAEGKSAADRARSTYGVEPTAPDLHLPEDLRQMETVGVMCDEVDGLHFLSNFGVLEEAFANPELVAKGRHRQAVLGYLRAKSIPPSALRRLAERDTERASRVFERVLRQSGFAWERDGEALLRRYKVSYFEQPALPAVTPLSGPLARATMGASAGEDLAGPRRRPTGRLARKAKRTSDRGR